MASRRWRGEPVCLALIMAGGLALRLYGLDWGYPAHLHCDENSTLGNALSLGRHLAETGLPCADRSNYGNLPYFLLWVLLAPASALLPALGVTVNTGDLALLLGRAVSALSDAASILFVYLLARRLFGPLSRLLSAGLYAATLLSVREAHFFTVDSVGTLTILVLLWLALRAAEHSGWRSYLWCGVGLGLALSVKVSAALLAPIPLLVWALAAAREGRNESARPTAARTILLLLLLAAAGGLALRGEVHGRLAALAQEHLTSRAGDLAATGHAPLFWQRQAEAMVAAIAGMFDKVMVLMGLLVLAGLISALLPRGRRAVSALWRRLAQPVALLLVAAGVFVLVNPCSVLQPRAYWLPGARDSVLSSLLIVGGANRNLPFAFTFQFVGTTPSVYQFRHVYPYALGWPLMAVALLASVYWFVLLLARRAGPVWVPLAALLILFANTGTAWVKMMRYVLPQMPIFCLLAGGMLEAWALSRFRAWRAVGALVAVATLVGSLLWCLAYLSLYAQPDSRLQALAWVQQHAPAGSKIVVEEDDAWGAAGLALWQGLFQYQVRVYDPHYLEHDYLGLPLPTEVRAAKEQYLLSHFTWADYVVLTGLRRERMAPVASGFPVQFPFYALLFSGRAGFDPVAAFAPEPRLFIWTFSDRGSEPTFRLFDHPDVYVFARRPPERPHE